MRWRAEDARGQSDGQSPITLWPTRRACGACQQEEVRALVSAAKSAGGAARAVLAADGAGGAFVSELSEEAQSKTRRARSRLEQGGGRG
jgi:hypothetical protein